MAKRGARLETEYLCSPHFPALYIRRPLFCKRKCLSAPVLAKMQCLIISLLYIYIYFLFPPRLVKLSRQTLSNNRYYDNVDLIKLIERNKFLNF